MVERSDKKSFVMLNYINLMNGKIIYIQFSGELFAKFCFYVEKFAIKNRWLDKSKHKQHEMIAYAKCQKDFYIGMFPI